MPIVSQFVSGEKDSVDEVIKELTEFWKKHQS